MTKKTMYTALSVFYFVAAMVMFCFADNNLFFAVLGVFCIYVATLYAKD